MICDFDLKFRETLDNLVLEAEDNGMDLTQQRSLVLEYLKTVKQEAINNGYSNIDEYLDEWADFVNLILEWQGIPKLNTLYIKELIQNPELASIDEGVQNTTAVLDVTVRTKDQFRKDFLEKIFGNANNARQRALKTVEFNLNNAMIFDRINGGITRNSCMLNRKLREYQQKLLDTVFTYLKSYYSNSDNKLSSHDYSIYDSDSLKMYNEGEYTGVFDLLFQTAATVFNTFDSSKLNEEYIYNSPALEAFIAFQTLLHFDEFLINTFGDTIIISNLSERFSGKDKYSFETKTANMFWHNQKDDDIDISKSVNNISKLIVLSTRMYDFNSGLLLDNRYVTYGLFISVITKLHDLSWDLEVSRNIMLNKKLVNSEGEEEYIYDLSDLSQDTENFIRIFGENFSLASLINKWRRYPRQVTTAVFELLGSTKLRNSLYKVFDKFTGEEKMVIVSLAKELFNNSGNSLRHLLDIEGYSEDSINYLGYILQTTDSTWMVKNCQYFLDPETSLASLKSLMSSNIYNIQRNINDSLNILNSYITNNTSIELEAKQTKIGFTFNLPLENKTVKVKIDNMGKVTVDNKIVSKLSVDDLEQLIPFINKMTHFNFSNPNTLRDYMSVSLKVDVLGGVASTAKAIEELFNFSAELLRGQHVARTIAAEYEKNPESDKKKKLEELADGMSSDYYTHKVKFDYGTIDIVPSKMLNVMTFLAETKALADGAFTATQVNDSEGNALGTSTPSRLVSAIQLQFEGIRENPKSPASHFYIILDPSVLLDIQTVREFKSAIGEVKTYNAFNTREFLESSVLYDFLYPLIGESHDKGLTPRKGIVAVTPTVNSDKNTISKMILSLGSLMKEYARRAKIPGNTDYDSLLKQFLLSDSGYMHRIINKDLGDYYEKLFTKVTEDLKLYALTSTWQLVLGSDFNMEYSSESFAELNERLAIYNSTAEEKITARQLFDRASRETGLKYNQQIHVIFNKGKATINNSLYALRNRYTGRNAELKAHNMPTSDEFWKYKNAEIVQYMLKNKVDFDLKENPQIYKFLESLGILDWVSDSGKLVIAKIGDKKITKATDLTKVYDDNILDDIHKLKDVLTLNPLIDKLNLIDYLYSQEYILSSVGTHLNHPNKKASAKIESIVEALLDEAARYQAQHKRNVSLTASMHEFLLNQLDGIPTNYNISVIEDIRDLAANLAGDLASVKPFDGATIVNPFVVHLENKSLKGEGKTLGGVIKKQFVHFYDEELGTGGIIKTAGFGISNSWMRNSPFLERMMKNMTDISWTTELGQPVVLDITKKDQNKPAEGDNKISYNIFFKKPVKSNGVWKNTYYKVTDIKSLGNNSYSLEIWQVNETGETIRKDNDIVVNNIDSNYKVWKHIFMGLNSVGLNKDMKLSDKGWEGESSILNTVKAINYCGFLLSGNEAIDLDNYWQPMKHSDTHYLVTEGAIKLGDANFNTKDWYYRDGNGTSYNRYKIKMLLAGIQLDKEHHADDSEISMMTQVISACAALGHNWDLSNALYNALYSLAMQGVKPILTALENTLQTGDKAEFQKILAGMIVKQLANGSQSSDGIAYTMAIELIEKYKSGEVLTSEDLENNPLPISNPVLFGKVQSLLSSMLTSSAIKLKFKGILSVLVPSHEIMKLYGGKLKSDFVNFEEEIKDLLAQYDANPVTIQDVQIGRTYKIIGPDNLPAEIVIDGKPMSRVHIQAPLVDDGVYGDPTLNYIGYYDLRESLPEGYLLIEDVTLGRNLAAFFCTFNHGLNKYNFYDLKESRDLYMLSKITDIESLRSFIATRNDMELSSLLNAEYEISIIDDKKALKRYVAEKVKALNKILRRRLQKAQNALLAGKEVTVNINGKDLTIIPENVKIQPYEIIMPKTFANVLGLTPEDSIDSLLNDKKVFTRKFISNIANKVSDESKFTVALKKLNGDHVYVLDREQFNAEGMLPVDAHPVVDPVDGKVYRTHEGDKMYRMSSERDLIYQFEGKDIIVTDDVNFYLENNLYNLLYVSSEASAKKFGAIYKYAKTTNNKALQNWLRAVRHDNEGEFNPKNARQRNQQLGNVYINSEGALMSNGVILDDVSMEIILTLGDELYSSFKKSLDIIAARIPAQSMQSFMPMRVVGYEDFDSNTAYVSTAQIWLQGSDFDIDAVSLLTFELGRDGRFVGWSSLFDYSSEENLEISTLLSYPTGENIKMLTTKDIFGRKVVGKDKAKNYMSSILRGFSFYINGDNIELGEGVFTLKDKIITVNALSTSGILGIENIEDPVTKENFIKAFNDYYSEIFAAKGLPYTNMDDELVIKALKLIQDEVDKHNNYVLESRDVEAFTKNFVVLQMITIAKDLRNLLQALMSVDQTTDEPKAIADRSAAGKLVKNASPGNFANKYLSIEDNHVGKDVIGISAVGLKGFFAITQYVNTILNIGTAEEIAKLFDNPLIFKGKRYFTVANANHTKNNSLANLLLVRIDGQQVNIQDILEAGNARDAALLISALLSLATDNAKELCLAKLNANARMAGMYIYGLTMGISYQDLGDLLMSDIGNLVSQYLKGSIITDKLGLYSIDNVLEHLDNPFTKIRKLYLSKKLWNNAEGNTTGLKTIEGALSSLMYNKATSASFMLQGVLANKYFSEKRYLNINMFMKKAIEDLKKAADLEDLNSMTKDLNVTLDSLRSRLKNNPRKLRQNNEMLHEAVDLLEEALNIVYTLRKAELTLWDGAYSDFKKLHEGAKELSHIGKLLGANQGVKNLFVDYVKYINNFEGTIRERSKKADYVNITDFMEDSQKRAEYMNAYEEHKISFNPLKVMYTVPQFRGYLMAEYLKHRQLYEGSINYRTIYHNLREVDSIIGKLDIEKKIRSLQALVEYKSNNNYFISNNKYFWIPKGLKIISLKSESESSQSTATENTKIYLGTQGGNATFKNWVEQQVIPDLMEGYSTSDHRYKNTVLANNGFIKSLRPNVFTKNPNRSKSISYTTSVNMSPRNDEDKLQLDLLRQDFDGLGLSYLVIDPDTGQVIHSIPIKDIFYWYNIIAYNGKLGLGTLTKIFDNYSSGLESKAFNLSLSSLDRSDTVFAIDQLEMINWLAQVENPYTSYSKYIYYKNTKELRMDLMKHRENDELETSVGLFLSSDSSSSSIAKIDTNLITHNPSKTDLVTISDDTSTIKYDLVTRKLHSGSIDRVSLTEEQISEINSELSKIGDLVNRYNPETDSYELQEDTLLRCIKAKINC